MACRGRAEGLRAASRGRRLLPRAGVWADGAAGSADAHRRWAGGRRAGLHEAGDLPVLQERWRQDTQPLAGYRPAQPAWVASRTSGDWRLQLCALQAPPTASHTEASRGQRPFSLLYPGPEMASAGADRKETGPERSRAGTSRAPSSPPRGHLPCPRLQGRRPGWPSAPRRPTLPALPGTRGSWPVWRPCRPGPGAGRTHVALAAGAGVPLPPGAVGVRVPVRVPAPGRAEPRLQFLDLQSQTRMATRGGQPAIPPTPLQDEARTQGRRRTVVKNFAGAADAAPSAGP